MTVADDIAAALAAQLAHFVHQPIDAGPCAQVCLDLADGPVVTMDDAGIWLWYVLPDSPGFWTTRVEFATMVPSAAQ